MTEYRIQGFSLSSDNSNYQDRLVEAILASSSDFQLVQEVYKRDRSLASQMDSPQELLNQLVKKLGNNQIYREHYREFVGDFTYGESLSFDKAIDSLRNLIDRLIE